MNSAVLGEYLPLTHKYMLQLRLRFGTNCPPPHSLQTRHAIARSRALICTPFARATQPILRLSYVIVHCLRIEPRAERLLSIPALAFVGDTDAFSMGTAPISLPHSATPLCVRNFEFPPRHQDNDAVPRYCNYNDCNCTSSCCVISGGDDSFNF
jgi:hypothetical protein